MSSVVVMKKTLEMQDCERWLTEPQRAALALAAGAELRPAGGPPLDRFVSGGDHWNLQFALARLARQPEVRERFRAGAPETAHLVAALCHPDSVVSIDSEAHLSRPLRAPHWLCGWVTAFSEKLDNWAMTLPEAVTAVADYMDRIGEPAVREAYAALIAEASAADTDEDTPTATMVPR